MPKGCYVDRDYGRDDPDLTCDLELDSENENFGDCIVAERLKMQGKTKEDCEHWKEIIPTECIHGIPLDVECVSCLQARLDSAEDLLYRILTVTGNVYKGFFHHEIRVHLESKLRKLRG